MSRLHSYADPVKCRVREKAIASAIGRLTDKKDAESIVSPDYFTRLWRYCFDLLNQHAHKSGYSSKPICRERHTLLLRYSYGIPDSRVVVGPARVSVHSQYRDDLNV